MALQRRPLQAQTSTSNFEWTLQGGALACGAGADAVWHEGKGAEVRAVKGEESLLQLSQISSNKHVSAPGPAAPLRHPNTWQARLQRWRQRCRV